MMTRALVLFITTLLLLPPLHIMGAQEPSDWSAAESALGRKGVAQPGGVERFNFPRRDLKVVVNGVTIRPAFALGSWVAFKRIDGGNVMVMGDLVLLEREVKGVVAALQQGGVEQTAIHNHLLGASPNIMYVHVMGHGDEAGIAKAIRAALAQSATPLGDAPAGTPPRLDLDTAAIAAVLGRPGVANGGVYQTSFPRADTIREAGNIVPPAMGVATAINFQPTARGRAAITGDFVLAGDEVNRAIRALTQNGIAVTALHTHLIDETPRLYFMHFWANDDALKLARGLRAALDEIAKTPRVSLLPNDIRWSRASAEHRALFLQTYRLAAEQLERRAAGLARGSWAVILDADETVLDNWQYQRERAQLDSGFSSASWNAWVRRMAAPALPGAVAFTNRVHELGGRVAIVTNRDEATCPETRQNLERDSIVADVVLCQTGPGDKNPRFQAVEQGKTSAALPPLTVLMWVGDNIQDFPGLRQDVRQAPDSALADFGVRYVLLPNPMYGSWERNPVP